MKLFGDGIPIHIVSGLQGIEGALQNAHNQSQRPLQYVNTVSVCYWDPKVKLDSWMMCDANYSTDGYCQVSPKMKDSYSQTNRKPRRNKKSNKMCPNILVRVQVPPAPKVVIKKKPAVPDPQKKKKKTYIDKEVIKRIAEETCKKKKWMAKDTIHKVLIDRIEEDQLLWKRLQIEESEREARELKTCLALWQKRTHCEKKAVDEINEDIGRMAKEGKMNFEDIRDIKGSINQFLATYGKSGPVEEGY